MPPPYGQECFGTTSLRNVNTPFCNTPHTERAVSRAVRELGYVPGQTFDIDYRIRMAIPSVCGRSHANS